MRSNQLSYPAIAVKRMQRYYFFRNYQNFSQKYFVIRVFFVILPPKVRSNQQQNINPKRMRKQRIDIEYPLNTKSPNIVWDQISSAHGLERWFADHVEESDGILTFTWGEPWTEQDIRKAHLVEYVKYDHIRLKWDYDDEEDDTYWEMRIAKSELTHLLTLLITDFADDDDTDALKILWESNLDRLHRASGL